VGSALFLLHLSMATEIVAINSYDNASGNRKAIGFDTMQEMLDYIHANLDEKRQVLWKSQVSGQMGVNQIKQFYRTINGSLTRTIIKDYFHERKHKRDPSPPGWPTPDKYVDTFVNLWEYLNETHFLLVWKP
jgi:hypothetical protein